MPSIFINYRREDSAGHAGRMYDKLVLAFQENQVFMDVDDISPGVDFPSLLTEEVARCGVFLALIGPRWLQATDAEGRRRIDNPVDFVRIEIEAALQSGATVIPVLLPGASMPTSETLPGSLARLARLNAFRLGERFHPEMDRLILLLKELDSQSAKALDAQKRVVDQDKVDAKGPRSLRPPRLPDASRGRGYKKVKILGAFLLLVSMAFPLSSCTHFEDAQGNRIEIAEGSPAPEGFEEVVSYDYALQGFDVGDLTSWLKILMFTWPTLMASFLLLFPSKGLPLLFRLLEIPLAVYCSFWIYWLSSFLTERIEVGAYLAVFGFSIYVIGAIWEDFSAFRQWRERRAHPPVTALEIP